MKIVILMAILFFGCISEVKETASNERIEELEKKIEKIEEKIQVLDEKINEIEIPKEKIIETKNEEKNDDGYEFLVTVENIGSTTINNSIFIVHKPPSSISYLGAEIPQELKEYILNGNSEDYIKKLNLTDGLQKIYEIKNIEPNKSKSFSIFAIRDRPRETYLSGLSIMEGDSYSGVNNIALFNAGNGQRTSVTLGKNYDAGIIDDGIETSRPVIINPVLSNPSIRVIVTPK